MKSRFIVGIGGTTRVGSSSEMLVRSVLKSCNVMGAETLMFGGAELSSLPFYAPENPERTEIQRVFVDAVRRADGIVIGTPSYHAGISALVKNAVDLLQDTMGDQRSYLDGCPVGLVICAAGWQATGATLSAMRDIVCSLRGWSTPISITVNTVQQKLFGPDGELAEDSVRAAVEGQARQLMAFHVEKAA